MSPCIAWCVVLFVLAIAANGLVAQTEDPFSPGKNPLLVKSSPAKDSAKREKVVVHTATLDLTIRWMEIGDAIAFRKSHLYRLSDHTNRSHEQR